MIAKTTRQKIQDAQGISVTKKTLLLSIGIVISFLACSKVIAAEEATKSAKVSSKYQVKFKARADHDFLLTADYRFFPEKASEKNMPGVIVLHDCQSERSKYQALSLSIAEQGLHTLSLDFRGYGNSIAQGYSELEVKKKSKDIVSYQNDVAVLMSYWADDCRQKCSRQYSTSLVGCRKKYTSRSTLAGTDHLVYRLFCRACQ